MTASLSVPLVATVVYRYKSCVLHLSGPRFSPPLFQFPATSDLPSPVWVLFDVSLLRLSHMEDILVPSEDTRGNLSVSISVLPPLHTGHPV